MDQDEVIYIKDDCEIIAEVGGVVLDELRETVKTYPGTLDQKTGRHHEPSPIYYGQRTETT